MRNNSTVLGSGGRGESFKKLPFGTLLIWQILLGLCALPLTAIDEYFLREGEGGGQGGILLWTTHYYYCSITHPFGRDLLQPWHNSPQGFFNKTTKHASGK